MLDILVLVSGAFSILAVFPLVFLALRSVREARDLRIIQYELASLIRESKEIGQDVQRLQREIRLEQKEAKRGIDETKRTVEQATEAVEQAAEQVTEVVAEATSKKRRTLSPRAFLRMKRPLMSRSMSPGTEQM